MPKRHADFEPEPHQQDQQLKRPKADPQEWDVDFRNAKFYVPFQDYKVRLRYRWYYSDQPRNKFVHSTGVPFNPESHDSVMKRYNLYNWMMPSYLDRNGAWSWQNCRDTVLACRSGTGGKFKKMEFWYRSGKRVETLEYAQLDLLWSKVGFPGLMPPIATRLFHGGPGRTAMDGGWVGLPTALLNLMASFLSQAELMFSVCGVSRAWTKDVYSLLKKRRLILFEGQGVLGDLNEAKVGDVVERSSLTCAAWNIQGATLSMDRGCILRNLTGSVLVVHELDESVKTIVLQEIESFRGYGSYWNDSDVLIQPRVKITIKKRTHPVQMKSYSTLCSDEVDSSGLVVIVFTRVTCS
jgi:hypothetical protein